MDIITGVEIAVHHLGPLTLREAEILLWVAEGKTSWEAGMITGIRESTSNAHVAAAMGKLNASSRAHLVARVFVQGILRPLAIALLCLCMLANSGEPFRARQAARCRRRDDLMELTAPALT